MNRIPLYLGHEHECPYLEARTARMAFISPDGLLRQSDFGLLVANGFRRSGDLVYRTYCHSCSDCVPVRIPVADFQPDRSQRRIARNNAGLLVIERPANFDEAHYQLYVRYLRARHPDSNMGQAAPEEYISFLSNNRFEGTRFFEFREDNTLLAVAVVDILDHGLSAVYTFFEPEAKSRSLGTFAILWQIREAQRRGLGWVYLGFWIRKCRKMAYKSRFRPLEHRIGTEWIRVADESPFTGC